MASFTSTLLEKQSKFPRYNMKCGGKPVTTCNIPRIVSCFPRYFSCYIAESRLPLGQCKVTFCMTNQKIRLCTALFVLYREHWVLLVIIRDFSTHDVEVKKLKFVKFCCGN